MVMRTDTVDGLPKLDLQPAAAERMRTIHRAEVYDAIYANAEGDPSRVPWAELRACPIMVHWLNHEAPRMVRPGSRSVVVGCGLGDDVVELTQRGYDVVGFDCSPNAARWAARRHPNCADRFLIADLLDVPMRLAGRFDLVVDVSTLTQIDPDLRAEAMGGIARLLSPRGVAVLICRGRPREEPLHREDGPPWAMTDEELVRLASGAGLTARRAPEEMPGDEHPPRSMMLAVFSRG
ncbi:MAG: class I SAM-dependent methyltransferase [Phycisphaerales bacterium]